MKFNIIALRERVQAILSAEVGEVFYSEATSPAIYPYAVFELLYIGEDYGKHLLQLDINLIDRGADTSVIENLADNIQNKLDFFHYTDDVLSISTYITKRNEIQEKNKENKRRLLTFQLNYYSKEN